jgi:phenylacetate-CoA ligase
MSVWLASRAGLRTFVKRLAGYQFRQEVQRSWVGSSEDFWNSQAERLNKIYTFARARVPYYRERPEWYRTRTFTGASLLSDLRTLPILPKSAVRENNEMFWATPRLPLTSFHTTSGTSGTPLRLPATIHERGLTEEILSQWNQRICGSRTPRTLFLSGFLTPSQSDEKLVWHDRATGDAYLSIYGLGSANRGAVIDLFRRLQPERIYGYASAVHQLALLLGDAVVDVKDSCFAVVTSEVLFPNWRATIEAAICRKVYDLYGSQEGSHLAIECEAGRLHIHPMIGIVEIVDDAGQPVPAGGMGRVLVTGLARRSMPLFRYELGDAAESTGYSDRCDCGLSWPTIGLVQGRSEDLVETRDGRRIGYLCFHATKNLRGIREAQLVQTDYESFTCNLVLVTPERANTSEIEAVIRQQLLNRLGADVDVSFRYMSEVPRGPGGKFKAVEVRMAR